MSTKKVAVKKEVKVVAKKSVAKKEVVKNPEQKKVKAEKAPKVKKSKVELVSFSVTAVIPTMQYGNIQPRIEVKAETIEEARALIMPVIENFYAIYSEKPVKFHPVVTEVERVVDMKVAPTPTAVPVAQPAPAPVTATVAQPASTPVVPAPAASAPVTPEEPKTTYQPDPSDDARFVPFKKAEKAINLATSHAALEVIENQIKDSVKINPADKPALFSLLTEKKNSIPF